MYGARSVDETHSDGDSVVLDRGTALLASVVAVVRLSSFFQVSPDN